MDESSIYFLDADKILTVVTSDYSSTVATATRSARFTVPPAFSAQHEYTYPTDSKCNGTAAAVLLLSAVVKCRCEFIALLYYTVVTYVLPGITHTNSLQI